MVLAETILTTELQTPATATQQRLPRTIPRYLVPVIALAGVAAGGWFGGWLSQSRQNAYNERLSHDAHIIASARLDLKNADGSSANSCAQATGLDSRGRADCIDIALAQTDILTTDSQIANHFKLPEGVLTGALGGLAIDCTVIALSELRRKDQ